MCFLVCFIFFFFFKQKTAYEMRISDWSSDVCSSDLALTRKQDAIVSACRVFTAEQKAEHSLIVFIGHDGIEQVAFTRSAKGTAADGPKPPRPDYSQKVMDQLGGIRTMAVREALASDPELALDVRSEEPTSELQSLM